MNFFPLILVLGFVGYSVQQNPPGEMHCGLRTCGIELLNFNDLSFSAILQKVHVATFCIRECSPPAVHEFFQSLSFAVTKRIIGVCSGDACIEKNRFLALGQCAKNKSWPLIQCGTRLVDLAQLALEPVSAAEYKNRTCNTVFEVTKCVELNLGKCGDRPISLFKEVFEDILDIGLTLFCRRSYKKDGLEITLPKNERTTPLGSTVEIPTRKPVAKGYRSRKNGASALQTEIFVLLGSIAAFIFTAGAMR